MPPGRSNPEVVVAGGGPAAAAVAIGLAASGIGTLLLVSPHPTLAMAEAIPAATLPLFEAIGLMSLIRRVGRPVKGIENWWDVENPTAREDAFVLVDRVEFARRMLEEAAARGAAIETTTQRPALIHRGDRIVLDLAGRERDFDTAIDATGRAAIWSRPIKRIHQMIADIFEGPSMGQPHGLRVVRADEGWAYRLGPRNFTTVATVSPRRRRTALSSDTAQALGISSREVRRVGRRVSGVQWAECPIKDRIIAIGDAALAHDPISGQGIRFALASAIAAASVIRTWRRSPGDRTTPTDFYTDFVTTERRRHLQFVGSFYGTRLDADDEPVGAEAGTSQLATTEGTLRFAGRIESAPLHVAGFIERGEVIRLRDGGAVRWLGGFDLLRLREMAQGGTTAARLTDSLGRQGLDTDRAGAIISWCMRNGILGVAVD